MHKFFLIVLILISAFTLTNCKDESTEPPETDTVTTTTKAAETTTPEVIEPVEPEAALTAVFDYMTSALLTDNNEYNEFMDTLDTISQYINDPTDDKLSVAVTKCADLHSAFSSAPAPKHSLTQAELAAFSEIGVDEDSYNGIFDNLIFLHHTKTESLSGLNGYLSVCAGDDEELAANSRYIIETIVPFYAEYNKLFQINLYYMINSIVNDCSIESDIITDFRDNVYPNLIDQFSDSIKWEDDNDLIGELSNEVHVELERVVDLFLEYAETEGIE